MLKTLHGRLLLVLLALLIPLGVLFVFVTLTTAQRYYQEITQRLNADLAASIVSDMPDLMIDSVVNPEQFDALAGEFAMANPSVEVYIVNDAGEIVGSSVAMGELERKQIAAEPIEAFMAMETPFPIQGTDPRNSDGQKIFSVAPLAGGEGYLYVLLADTMGDSVIRRAQNSTVLRLGLWSGAVVLVLVFGVGVLAFNLLTRRLRRLESAMMTFRERDFVVEKPLLAKPTGEGDEIDKLQTVFAEMSGRISEQVQGLRQVDTLRRELITNVSHDLRTPLAALQGYLETLQLREASLSDEQRHLYLESARKQAERLNRLIGDLFDLSRLDANAVEAHLEPFPLQELAQDVVLKFSGIAEQQGVELELAVPDSLPFVNADIGLIERALTNLVSNALRYTPAGGRVRLELSPGDNRVKVNVADTGSGIAEEDLPHIFERFFRAQENRDDGGTGLGLAITRRILELHNSTITVKSQPGSGTTFSFPLAVA